MAVACVEAACTQNEQGFQRTYSWLQRTSENRPCSVWVALNIAKLFPSPISLPALKANDLFDYASV